MLSFGQSITLFFKRIFSFTGRSSRAEFWWAMLLYFILSFALMFVMGFSAASYDDFETINKLQTIAFAISLLLIPLNVRRLHDLGLHGAWAILFYLPLVSLAMYVVAALPSQHKLNKYGADPVADPHGHFNFYREGMHERFGAYGLQSQFDQFFGSGAGNNNFKEF